MAQDREYFLPNCTYNMMPVVSRHRFCDFEEKGGDHFCTRWKWEPMLFRKKNPRPCVRAEDVEVYCGEDASFWTKLRNIPYILTHFNFFVFNLLYTFAKYFVFLLIIQFAGLLVFGFINANIMLYKEFSQFLWG